MISDSKQSNVSKISSNVDSLNIYSHDLTINLSSSISMSSRRKSKQSKDQKQIFAKTNERSLNKKKKKTSKFYDVIEILRLFDRFTNRQIIEHLLKKFDLIDQHTLDVAEMQTKQFRKIDERFNQLDIKFDDRFNQIIEHLKTLNRKQDEDREKRRHLNRFSDFSIEMSEIFVFNSNMFSLYNTLKSTQLKNDLNKSFFNEFIKSVRFDDNDSLQDVMLRLAKFKKMKSLSIEKNKFRESNIDYFDSHKFESYEDDDYVIVTNKIYYRNVWLFIDAIKSIAISKKSRLIRTHLHRCFQNDVQTWYIDELDDLQRFDLKRNQDLQNWEKKFISRFKMSESEIMNLLIENKYTIEDVRKKRTVISYVQNVIRHAKNADFTTINNQFTWAWNHLAFDLQRDIKKSIFKIIVLEFMNHLKEFEHVWRRYYAMKISSKKRWDFQNQSDLLFASSDQYSQYQQSNQNYSREKRYMNNQNYDQASLQNFQRSYQNNDQINYQDNNRATYSRNNQWNSQNRQNQYSNNSRSVNQQYNQQRMIETSSQRQTSWTKFAYNVLFVNFVQVQTFAYHASQKDDDQREIYHDHEKKKIEHQQFEHHSAMIEIFFNDSNKFELSLNSWSCDKCSIVFDNSDELRDHLLNYHSVDSRISTYNKRLQDEKYVKHAKKHVYNYSSQFFFDYAQVNVFIFDYDLVSCLNIDEEMNLCFRSLFSQNKNLYDIVHRTRLITVTKVAKQQICDECIEQEILLDFNKFSVKINTYLIDRLQSDLIIDMNVLDRDDMNFQLSRNMFVIEEIDVLLRYSSMKIQTFYHFVICNIMKSIQKFRNRKWRYDAKKSMNNASKMLCIFDSCVRIEIINANLETFNEIDQSEAQNYIQCENAKFEEFSAKYDDLNKFRNVSFLVARFVVNFVCVFYKCRRCKQFFDFDNLFHRHLIHCNRDIKFRDVVRDLIAFWKRL